MSEKLRHNTQLSERLPSWVLAPCIVSCAFDIKALNTEYLLSLWIDIHARLCCQSCLEEIAYDKKGYIELMICSSEARADELMASFECIVIQNDTLPLDEILTDELYFSLPEVPHECTFISI